jgi:hypothetical protein
MLFYVGSSIKALRSSNCHILASEANSKLFDEVLKPLKNTKPLSKSPDIDMSENTTPSVPNYLNVSKKVNVPN